MKKIIFLIGVLLFLSSCAKSRFDIFEFKKESTQMGKNYSFDLLKFDLDIDEDKK